jgi:hypothetical protein
VDAKAVSAAATAHLHVDAAAVVLVGDADAFGAGLEAAGLGPIVIERDPIPEFGPSAAEAEAAQGPVDVDDQDGPTAGAEETDLPPAEENVTGPH